MYKTVYFADNSTKNGLLWEELNNIVGEDAPPTLSRLELPITPLVEYIPEIIKEFRLVWIVPIWAII